MIFYQFSASKYVIINLSANKWCNVEERYKIKSDFSKSIIWSDNCGSSYTILYPLKLFAKSRQSGGRTIKRI
jgi:hypothetical protein